MPKRQHDGDWKPIVIESVMAMKGGLLGNKEHVILPTKVICTDTKSEIFVKVDKGQRFIFASTGGSSRQFLRYSKCLDVLEKAIQVAGKQCSDDTDSPVTTDTTEEDPDPMDELEDLQPAAKQPRVSYRSVRAKDKILDVPMPVEPGSEEQRTVRVYCESTRKTHLSINDVSWLLSYIRHEVDHPFDIGEPDSPEASEVVDPNIPTGFRVEWCFHTDAWKALEGDREVLKFSPSQLDAATWASASHLHQITCTFAEATQKQRHEASRQYVCWRIQAMFGQTSDQER
jgi:hypothetical protein